MGEGCVSRVLRAAAILAVGVAPCLAGCGKGEPEGKAPALAPAVDAARPAAKAPEAAKAERAVLDEEVRKRWKAVELIVHEKAPGGISRKVQVAIGAEVAVEGLPLVIRALGFVPDFAMGTDSVATKSMEAVNPAVKIQVLDSGREIFKGWAFRDYPDMHSFEDPRYTIMLTRAIPAGK
jgi:hypothetical protein